MGEKIVEPRYEAYWSEISNTVTVRPIGEWINEAKPCGVMPALGTGKDIKYASGYGSTPKMAKRNCEENREFIIKTYRLDDEGPEVEGM
jgi:hypothetical protein